MHDIPQRRSLSSQTADILREGIRTGGWVDRLPSERAMCGKYQISRNTLRSALSQLHREGLIQAVHGSSNRILEVPKKLRRRRQSLDVGLLSPEPLERLRPAQALWIDELRAMLGERGCQLHVFHGRQYFRSKPGPALAQLVAKNRHECWILALSNEPIQRWFAEKDVRCVVAGSVHAGLDLPCRDLDHRAMCRHAAGVFLGLGHRKIALVIAKSNLAGDLESEAGFIDGVQKSHHKDAEAIICRHDSTVAGIGRATQRLMDKGSPPTALLVANAHHYLTVVSRLALMGRFVPDRISVISRDDDLFLSYLAPMPARYASGSQALARSLLRPILDLIGNEPIAQPIVRLMPEFIRGESLASPKA